ncbi:BlaI/MecI/CopY family transcriptional regulator [Actinomadura logoneensis]|uniref:BlaI/MecI/CopY family transcriptional regulator n=1 Tax=Actinomadura logoneensis TaxID=2293572 RepID=A0A372JJN6_9ACTN|nr:BlaI/MecI/CopY family transcriptional regulator [Actinomadura logoneensis]RFU40237.1 BlaI/MecI/CopY family transcriptional regulator [Actinomadura logoneensis]
MARRPLGRLEAEVLAVLASADAFISTADLRARLGGAPPAHTTLNTILTRLHGKGMVRRVRAGRQYEYRLTVNEADVVAGRMHEHLRFASDQRHALSRFVETLTGEQARILRAVLDDGPEAASAPLPAPSEPTPAAAARPERDATRGGGG